MFDTIKSVSKHTVIYGIGDLLSKGIGFLLIPLYTHYLSIDKYGTLELLELTTYIVGLLLAMGISQSVVRYYFEYDEDRLRKQVISVAMITIWVVGFVALAVLLFLSKEISILVFDTPDFYRMFNIVFITMVINLSNEIPMTVFRIEQKSTFYAAVSLCKLIINLTLNIIFIVHFHMGVMGIIVAGLIASSAAGIFLTACLLRQLTLSYSFTTLKRMLGYSFPLTWSWLGMFVLHFGDRFLLQRLDTLASVGIYALAYKFGMIANMLVITPFSMTWAPKRFEIVKEPDVEDTFGYMFTYLSFVQLFVSLGIAVLVKDVLTIVAVPEYHTAYQYVPLLLLAYVFYGSYSYVQFGILLRKKTKYLGIITLIVAGINVGLNLLLIPVLQVWGAVIATVVSLFLLTGATYVFAQKMYSIPYQWGRLLRLAVTAVALFSVAHFVNPSHIVVSLAVKFLIAASFPLLLYFQGFFTGREREKAKELWRQIIRWLLKRRRMPGPITNPDGSLENPENSTHMAILGYYGYANTGDEAILDCLVSGLRRSVNNLDITVFSGDPEHTSANYGVKAVENTLPTSISSFLIRTAGRNRRNFFKALRTFLDADVVLVGGGGLFFDHPSSNKYLLELLQKVQWSKRLGKKILVVGIGVGPIHLEQSKKKLQRALESADLITVRDAESVALLRRYGIDEKRIYSVADFVFLLYAASEERIDQILKIEELHETHRPRIGVCICGYHAELPGWKESIAKFCDYAHDELGARVLFIPMQTGGGFDDREGALEIVKAMSRQSSIDLIEGQYTPAESMGLIGRTDAVLAERLHGTILALNAHTPLFGISYGPKVSRLFAHMGHPDWQIELRKLTADALIAGFRAVWNDRTVISAELENISNEFRRQARVNFDLLRKALGKA